MSPKVSRNFRRKDVGTLCEPFGFLRTGNISRSELKPQRKWITEKTWKWSDKNSGTNWFSHWLSTHRTCFHLPAGIRPQVYNTSEETQKHNNHQSFWIYVWVGKDNHRTIMTAIVFKMSSVHTKANWVGVFKFLRILERFRGLIWAEGLTAEMPIQTPASFSERDPCQSCVFKIPLAVWTLSQITRSRESGARMCMWDTVKVMDIVIYVG